VKPYLSENDPLAKPNHPVPKDVRFQVERQPTGAVNSKSESGGYVAPGAFKQQQPKG
jgi:hypothetical protein